MPLPWPFSSAPTAEPPTPPQPTAPPPPAPATHGVRAFNADGKELVLTDEIGLAVLAFDQGKQAKKAIEPPITKADSLIKNWASGRSLPLRFVIPGREEDLVLEENLGWEIADEVAAAAIKAAVGKAMFPDLVTTEVNYKPTDALKNIANNPKDPRSAAVRAALTPKRTTPLNFRKPKP